MNQSSLYADEDQDSLFGSPPPSPARGRSPSVETLIAGFEMGPIIAAPSAEVGRKNVGTIALPGSHMSCAELPANLSASSLSLPRPASNPDSSTLAPTSITGTPRFVHTSVVASRSSTRSVPSRASSASSTAPASAPTRKRRMPKSKSATPNTPAPPITLPGPDEATPPNFLRSQSSLLGLAGLVGCVKPAQLYTQPQSAPVQQSRSRSPTRGSTPTHPIVIDDEHDTPYIGKRRACGEIQMPEILDQLDPDTLRSNVMNSLAKEKNIFPVLESLIKVLGGEPHLPSANHPPQPFARPYGHGIFNVRPSPSLPSLPVSDISASIPVPAAKRRKLKHVPAGAIDWDVPFPFAPGEGPAAYHDTWARDRAKQLVTQLLALVKNAAKRGAIRTAKSGGKISKGRPGSSSRSASVETQVGQINSAEHSTGKEANFHESSITNEQADVAMDGLEQYLRSLETGSLAPCSKDGVPVDPEVATEDGLVPPYAAFEEWLSQLQQFVPLEPNVESDRPTRPSVSSESLASGPTPDVRVSTPHTGDEAIDPALLAISQPSGSAPPSRSPTSPTSAVAPGDIPHALVISPTPPPLAHSPRTSLSSLTEPLTPLSETFADVSTSTIARHDTIPDHPAHQPIAKDHHLQSQTVPLFPCARESSEPHRITAVQKGKGRATNSVASATPSTSTRSTPSIVPASKGTLDKQGILERAREHRRQLAAELEQAKMELWETTLENAVLVHFMRDGSKVNDGH